VHAASQCKYNGVSMSRSPLHGQLNRIATVARFCENEQISTSEGLERMAVAQTSRRAFLKSGAVGLGSAFLAASGLGLPVAVARGTRIAIIGGGLAGLACADRLRAKGYSAAIYDANPDRLGGRCWSLRGFFPNGLVAENGGELIDNPHKVMQAYAREFGLPLEDLGKQPGELLYYFGGQTYHEAEVIDEFRQLVSRMQPDLQACSGAPTFFSHSSADVALDNTDLATYLETRGQGLPLITAVLKEAYLAEYGLECSQQSCLNLLLFVRLNRRSKFEPFGVSDERYHVKSGNDGIVSGIKSRLPGPISNGAWLEKVKLNASGEYELKFAGLGRVEKADYVVLAMPFTTLRDVVLDSNLGLSADKRRAIDQLGYGMNAKMMVGFNGRPWLENQGSNGASYSDLVNLQATWQSNPSVAGANAILTDYASGDRGANLTGITLQQQASMFLSDLNVVYPGSAARAIPSGSGVLASRTLWPASPYTKGSYTCYLPGQFTTVAGLESQSAGRLKFAGEHTDSFYSWQGYMEGACLSGIRAADEVLADIRAGV
jgi:monoamine oxidase